jgi:hypothetical protein
VILKNGTNNVLTKTSQNINAKLKNRTNDGVTKMGQNTNAKLRNGTDKVVTKMGRNIDTKNIFGLRNGQRLEFQASAQRMRQRQGAQFRSILNAGARQAPS